MSSKQQILNAIREHRLAESELPSLDESWITYDSPQQQFAETLQSVGGRCVVVKDVDQLQRDLETLTEFANAKRVCSMVDGLACANNGRSTVDLDECDDPHELEDIDFAILPGQFAVAENGAVWVTDERLRQRVVYFIAQHLALAVPRDAIVNNMHEAYQRLSFDNQGFGTFISGPSKTADIEQSLVIGAHGARSLTVFLVEA